jgi:hypothetical protein
MKKGLLFLLLSFLFFQSKAEMDTRDSLQEYGLGFHWNHKRKKIEIPFELHANLVVIPIKLNDSDTLRFLVDTGLGTTLLTDSTVYKQLNLRPIRQIELLGLGDEAPIKAQVIIDLKLQLGAATALHQNLIYVSHHQLNLSDYVGTEIQGVLGYELFSNAVVTIDYARQRLILTQLKDYHYSKRKGKRFDLEIVENKPYIRDVHVASKIGALQSKLLLDSGAGHVLFLDNVNVDSSKFSFSNQLVYLGKGLNGTISGYLGRVSLLRLGPWSWINVPSAFPQPKVSIISSKKSEIQGSIGGEFLRRYVVTFNYLQQFVVFKPIGGQWRKNFELDLSGLTFRTQGKKFRNFIVETVQENSPAAEAGIIKGDELLLINRVPASEYQLGDVYRILKKKEGKKVDLVIRRGLNFQMYQLKLRKLF